MNNKELRDYLSKEAVPEKISPEHIQTMLDEKAPARKRSRRIHRTLRFTAGAAACAVLCTFGVHYAGQNGISFRDARTDSRPFTDENGKPQSVPVSAMRSAADYGELYDMLVERTELYNDRFWYTADDITLGGAGMDFGIPEAENGIDYMGTDNAYNGEITTTTAEDSLRAEYSQPYAQEEGVLEADIVKTDGNTIYYLYTDYSKGDGHGHAYLNTASVDAGQFTDSRRLDLTADFGSEGSGDLSLQDMYLYNGMLIIIGTTSTYGSCIRSDGGTIGTFESTTTVNFYTADADPQHIGSYTQEGSYTDVRIMPDGFLYLVTSDSSQALEAIADEADVEQYVPTYGTNGCMEVLPPQDILLPETVPEECAQLSYIVTSSIDLRTEGSFSHCDTRAITGISGSVYCSDSNLYVAAGYQNTELHRIALESGSITPMASAEIKGYVKDQFSMSEYDGYFRIATSVEDWTLPVTEDAAIRNNYLYVMDMDLNIVGSIGDFGIGENIRSASFSGNTAYVVTYEQTDPLYSFDLSDPANPVMLDEYKILGYSTYMQQWSEGLLLGFGANADAEGVEDGVKLVMFDNADPTNLGEVGIHIISAGESGYLWSEAMHERKALLIAPEKNLIGVPVARESYGAGDWNCLSTYQFFSYENGQFIFRGELTKDTDFIAYFNRAIYIDDHVYALSGDCFAAASMDGIAETDRVVFS